MTRRTLERILWAASAIALAATAVGVRRAVPRLRAARPAVAPLLGMRQPPPPDSLNRLAERIAEADPFRLPRHPAAVAYGAPPPAAAPVATSRPTLTVSGLVGGPPWAALLSGVPGREGSVLVHAGDTLAGLRVAQISGSAVTLVGLDTTWHLTLNRPWH